MPAAERVIATAKGEVGYLGKKSAAQLDNPTANTGGKFNKYARDLDALGDFYNGKKNGYDWCDVFVDWCFVQTFGRETAQRLLCQPNRSCGAGTAYSLGYYKAMGQLFTVPKPGDQIFFGSATVTSHTGLVTAVGGGYVHTIEGNAGSPSAVRSCKYPLGYAAIKGYGRPDYSIVEEDEEMDLKDFKKLWQEMRKELQDNDSSAYSEAARKWAVESGLLQGDGQANYMWEDLMTREQLVTVLYRFAQQMGKV